MSNSMSCKWDLWMVAVLVCVAVVLCEATGGYRVRLDYHSKLPQ